MPSRTKVTSKDEQQELASNFELNSMKIGINTFQLMKGDRFTSNGHTMDYKPCKENTENHGKGKRYRYSSQVDNVNVLKYKKDILRADNIKLVVNRPLNPNGDEESQKKHRWMEWEVQYAYTVEKPAHDNLLVLIIELHNVRNDQAPEWTIRNQELEVQRETKENYFLKGSHPCTHLSQIPKSDLNDCRVRWHTYHVIGRVEDYAMLEMNLINYVEKHHLEMIETAKAHLQEKTNDFNKLLLFKSKQGY